MKKFKVDICEVINGIYPDCWDIDALSEPIKAEAEAEAIVLAIDAVEDMQRSNGNWAWINDGDGIEIHDAWGRIIYVNDTDEIENKADVIVDDTYEKSNDYICWKDLNGSEHTILFRVKEIVK